MNMTFLLLLLLLLVVLASLTRADWVQLGTDIGEDNDSGYVGTTVSNVVISNDGKTIRYDCSIFDGPDESDRNLLARGHLLVACCRFPSDGLPFPIPIPDDVLSAIESVADPAEAISQN